MQMGLLWRDVDSLGVVVIIVVAAAAIVLSLCKLVGQLRLDYSLVWYHDDLLLLAYQELVLRLWVLNRRVWL